MFNFPWTNFHELNLDWILSVVKEAKEVFDNGRYDIDYAVETADEAKEIATQAAESTIPDNSISSIKIQDGAVTLSKLAPSIVNSINNKALYLVNVPVFAVSGNIIIYNNDAITTNHVLAECVFDDPSVISSDVTWSTGTGTLTMNGTATAATAANILLIRKDN